MSEKPVAVGHFRLLYFAAAASYTKKTSDDFPAPLRVAELFALIERTYPGITQRVLSTSAVTVNLDYVDLEDSREAADAAGGSKGMVIREGDEVAIIPPVSSG